jgi:hypothetical protein
LNSGFPPGVTPHTGSWLTWLGGADLEDAYIQQNVTVPASAPYLAYWHWIGSDDFCGFDFATVEVNASPVDIYDLCTSTNTGGWVKHVVDLSVYSGQAISLRIRVTTDSSFLSSLLVDDVAFQSTPSLGAPAGATILSPDVEFSREANQP